MYFFGQFYIYIRSILFYIWQVAKRHIQNDPVIQRKRGEALKPYQVYFQINPL